MRMAFTVLFLFALTGSLHCAAQPMLSPPVPGTNRYYPKVTLMNCSDSNRNYIVETSGNLIDWKPVLTNLSSSSNFSVSVVASNQFNFYRLKIAVRGQALLAQFGILCKSNFNWSGITCSLDSFDSSDTNASTQGQWDITRRKANANLGSLASITNALALGNMSVYGHVYTGIGVTNPPAIGPNGSIGDLAWVSNSTGIEGFGTPTNWWQTNLNVSVPDVVPPDTTGWATALPAASNSVITLNGGKYVVPSLPSSSLAITAPTILWVQGPLNLGSVSFTNTGRLLIYVGHPSGTGDWFFSTMRSPQNVPGLAANLQIFGLPSLTSVDLHGNIAWAATIYAPEASVVVGGWGNNTQDSSGAIVANAVILKGRWNFHRDESLAVSGISF